MCRLDLREPILVCKHNKDNLHWAKAKIILGLILIIFHVKFHFSIYFILLGAYFHLIKIKSYFNHFHYFIVNERRNFKDVR